MKKLKPLAACLLAAAVIAGAVPHTVFAARTAETEESRLDYVLGRPMTEEEIQAQKAHVPKSFPNRTQETQMPAVPRTTSKINARQALPAAYDSRKLGYVTPVKHQGNWSTCWAFAAAACAETSMIVKNLADLNEADLSEQHLSYFTYHPQTDPLGNTAGDTVRINSSDHYMMLGTNQQSAAFVLSNWMGFADEGTAPYSTQEDVPAELKAEIAYEDTVHLNNAFWIAASDTQEVKAMLMKYGAAVLDIGYEDLMMNYNTAAFLSRQSSINHDVTIVGWDDTYSARNFLPQCRPSSDGAWLAKNSWGNEWGDNGYFWISYEEPTIHLDYSVFYFYDVEPADNYDHNYHYDGSINISCRTYEKQDYYVAAVYQTDAGRTGAESLEAIGIAVYGTNIDYSLQIYKNVTDRQNPESGIPVLESPQTGTLPYCGYHTIPLEQAVPMADGCTFSVVILLKRGENESISCYVDDTAENSPMKSISYITSQNPGETMMRTENQAWLDTALIEGDPFTLRIKAFTSDIPRIDLASCMAELSETSYIYDGTEKTPAVTVKNGSEMLVEGTDYNVSYSNNVNAGTASVTIRGIGYYTGAVDKYFTIDRQYSSITAFDVTKTASAAAQTFALDAGYDGDGRLIYQSSIPAVQADPDGWVTIDKNFIGSAVITITAESENYYAFSKSVKITVNPAAMQITSVKNTAGRSVKVNWKKDVSITGYQIQCALDKKFTKSVTTYKKGASASSLKISGLKKGKTYYIRSCVYKNVSGTEYYSDWSTVKRVKIKK